MAVLYDASGREVPLRASDTAVVAQPAANLGATLTLPAAGVGLYHYITSIRIGRSATAALVGSAALSVTTTNLGGIAWRLGNAMSIGGSVRDVELSPTTPMRSAAPNVATTIVLPVPGAAVLWDALVTYFSAP